MSYLNRNIGVIIAATTALIITGCQVEDRLSSETKQSDIKATPTESLSNYVLEKEDEALLNPSANFDIDEGVPKVPQAPEEILREAPKISGSVSPESRIYSASYSPLCPELDLNTLYNFTPSAGNYYCFYFDIPDASRTEFVALGQAVGRQVNVTVYHDEPANYTLTVAGTSSDTDADDSVLYFTEPGHYYMEMYATAGDGNIVQFAAASNTNVDDYENNDTLSNAYELQSDINRFVSNLDYAGDVDYFAYQSDHAQDLVLGLEDVNGTNEWVLEVLSGGSWTELSSNQEYNLSGFGVGGYAYVRVSQRSGIAHNQNHYYVLNFGTRIDSISDVDVYSNENLVRMTHGTTSPYYVTQVHNQLLWTAKIKDSTGQGIEGVRVDLTRSTVDLPAITHSERTDATGVATGSETMLDCVGNTSVSHSGWTTEFDSGLWFMDVPESRPQDDVGVGGDNVPYVTLAHICDQDLG